MKLKELILWAALCGGLMTAYGQNASEYTDGMKIKLNEDGSKYLRIIGLGQFWFQDYEGSNSNDGFSIRRLRVLMYSQVNDRFLLFTHFGLNSVNANNITPTGKTSDVDFFLHEAWAQYKVNPYLYMGAGLHYWNGINRLNSSGSINLLTVDNNRSSWPTLGLSDQLGMSLGIYAKGMIDRFAYRVSLTNPNKNTLDTDVLPVNTEGNKYLPEGQEKYAGRYLMDKGKYAYAGYFEYQFMDKESDMLPYKVGSYLGSKKVFNLGAGFFHHSNGLAKMVDGKLEGKDVTHFAVDAFFDSPLGIRGASITAYASYQHSWMDDYHYGNIVGNGDQFYAQVGYLLPKFGSDEDGKKKYRNRLQPYVAYSNRNFTSIPEPAKELRLGANWYLDGQNARLTVEYQKAFDQPSNSDDMITVQAMIGL